VIPASRAELPRSGDRDERGELVLPPKGTRLPADDLHWLARSGGVAGMLSPICVRCELTLEGPHGFKLDADGYSICKEHEA
jgi:hypothetical protein